MFRHGLSRVKSGLVSRVALTLSALNLILSPATGSQLDFTLTGTLDSPTGVPPLLVPEFRINFRMPSDPVNLLFPPPHHPAIYVTATYVNGGITTPPLPHTYVIFNPGGFTSLPGFQYGGIYIFFSPTNEIPHGLAIQIERGAPQLYSGADAAPHFSPGIIDLSGALTRFANQGVVAPWSTISNPILTITPADKAPPTISISTKPDVLWPPDGRTVPVTAAGTIRDEGPDASGLALSSIAYSVADEYGEIQGTGAIDLQLDGNFAFVIPLHAWRRGTDAEGRHYAITVVAEDRDGNKSSAAAHITVPHSNVRPN
jgi:hypothetical protein